MYLDFHGFREKPFSLTPDPRFVFLSEHHREAFAHILYGINNRAGFIALTGEVGSGKTTVLRALLTQLAADRYRTALIFNPCLSPVELLRNINREFGIQAGSINSSVLLDTLNQFLLQQNTEGRIIVLAIDEAQDLETSVLEQIRLISNLETDREKLIQIVLSGQPEFVRILRKNELRQLNQRITVRYHLEPMDYPSTVSYIRHRLDVAGGKGGVIFSKGALKRICRYSGGLPRLINAACDRALLAGYTKDTSKIGSRIARLGIEDLKKETAHSSRKRRLILVPTSIALAALVLVGVRFARHEFIHQIDAPPRIEARVEPPLNTDPSPPAAEDPPRDIAADLGKISESESAREAFNSLAGFWNVSPVPDGGKVNQMNGMERAAQERGLRLYRFSGNLGALLRIDYPAVLELVLPDTPGKRFISLVGRDNEQLLTEPPIPGRRSLSFSEVERYWSGQGFLLWKDPLNLLLNLSPDSRGSAAKRLQVLLRDAGVYSGPLTGIYDGETVAAVKKFQSSAGIQEDGIVGGQTLMVLYRSADRFGVPRLTAGRK